MQIGIVGRFLGAADGEVGITNPEPLMSPKAGGNRADIFFH